MRDVEIDSDKYSVLGVVIIVASVLVILISDLYAFASRNMKVPKIHFWDYLLAVFYVYASVTIGVDGKIRKNYPYGVAGICLLALVLLMRIAAYWTGIAGTNNLWWTSMAIGDITSSSLLLVEGVRWFRARVRLKVS